VSPEKKREASAAEEPSDFFGQFQLQLEELERARRDSEKKATEYFERLQRLQADMENLQRITRRQVESITKQASENLMVKLLPILDALGQAGNFAQSGKPVSIQEIGVGLKMLLKQMIDTLRTEGLEEISAVGERLDPEKHEVVGYVETDDAPENSIVEEVRKGYQLNGKVIRPSLVVVSKAKTPPDAAGGETTK
jgi:molecular chaperone GrpE